MSRPLLREFEMNEWEEHVRVTYFTEANPQKEEKKESQIKNTDSTQRYRRMINARVGTDGRGGVCSIQRQDR